MKKRCVVTLTDEEPRSLRGWASSGVTLGYSILKDGACVILSIDFDRQSDEGNKAMFDELAGRKKAIEEEYGAPLHGERKDEGRACRISATAYRGTLEDEAKWPAA